MEHQLDCRSNPIKCGENHRPTSTVTLLSLPFEMIENILSYLSYDQIAKLRLVNKLFNSACSSILNKGFGQVQSFHNRCLKAVKSKLPRRESERKNHPLSRHIDILMAVETRLSMLSMTFTKYIDAQHCCFIPGKVLDEATKVLRLVSFSCALQSNLNPGALHLLPRPHDFLQEYRDISSMAMEHFDEKILPAIKEKMKQDSAQCRYLKFHSYQAEKFKQLVEKSKTTQLALGQKLIPSVPSNKLRMATCRTKMDCSIAHRRLQYKMKTLSSQTKLQNITVQRKLYQQKTMIMHLKKELRETRTAMNAMNKELNRLKTECTSAKDSTLSDSPLMNNLTIHATSSMSISADEQSPSFHSQGCKRRRVLSDEESEDI